jgi:hypothetical protein
MKLLPFSEKDHLCKHTNKCKTVLMMNTIMGVFSVMRMCNVGELTLSERSKRILLGIAKAQTGGIGIIWAKKEMKYHL